MTRATVPGMSSWLVIGLMGAGLAALVGQAMKRRKDEVAAARAAGLVPVMGLTHLPEALQKKARWTLSDGGFEQRVVHGVITRRAHDIDVTAFDMETLRQRRGEWAWLPLDRPFRIGPTLSIVVCETDLVFPHLLLKRVGLGDELEDDTALERTGHVAKVTRDALGIKRSYPAELPKTLPPEALATPLPEDWRAYGADAQVLEALVAAGFGKTLAQAGRRDLVIELIDTLIVVYPAALLVAGSDAFADLTETALSITDGLLAASPPLSPRGVEAGRPS
ncbi:MAG: hypothetical protein JNL83_27680 [Myxococcales bacterium]|nr:hypothetical protein [Myxococcales bacterium]